MTSSSGPIEIAATRGGAIESVHRVHAVVAGPDGDATHVFGDPDRVVFPRSSLKAIQALPLIETGAADHFQCTPQELALACASHEGEAIHTLTVKNWLVRLEMDQDALACGPQWPRLEEDKATMIRAEELPGRVHNNCSGKHSGMLTTLRHLEEDPDDYVTVSHNVQKRIFEAVEALSGQSLSGAPVGVDGCSAPNPALPLASLAVAAARYAEAAPARVGAVRAMACRRFLDAMLQAPEMIGGTGRFDTDLIRAFNGRVLSKTGAEGFYMLYLPEQNLGVALKAEDGASRASTAAVWSVLERLGMLDGQVEMALRPHCRPDIRNWDGLVTGDVREV
ncbi:asparaginase [Minwuia sp.]|uniref:asparaginase n=1 Tax=Minwuia sp. TaxID=2493630 RepID=UPI003A8EAEB9